MVIRGSGTFFSVSVVTYRQCEERGGVFFLFLMSVVDLDVTSEQRGEIECNESWCGFELGGETGWHIMA